MDGCCCSIDTVAGQPTGGGGGTPSDVTLQAALDGQNALGVPTEQSYVTAIDLNAGASWTWRNATNSPLITVSDGSGINIAQGLTISGVANATLAAGSTDNLAVSATVSVLRIAPNAAGSTLTSITNNGIGQQIEIFNVSTTASLTLTHNTGPTPANNFLLPNSANLVVPPNSSVIIWYDLTSARWRTASGDAGNAVVTLQAALDGQNTLGIPTEQTYDTIVDLNGGHLWNWRDAANASLFSIADGSGITIAQGLVVSGIASVTLGAGTTNDLAVAATVSVLQITPNAAGSTLTSIAAGVSGRQIEIFNVSASSSLTLTHDTGGTAANRFLLPNSQNLIVPPNSSVIIWYSTASSRWRIAAAAGATQTVFQGTFDTVGAAVVTVPLANLATVGSNVVLRSFFVSMVFRAPAAGDIGQINFGGVIQAQTNVVDGTVVFGPPPWGPPAGVPDMNSTGYQSPLTFGSPGGVGCVVQATGAQLELLVTVGFGGFTIRHNYNGDMFVYDGATRLHL